MILDTQLLFSDAQAVTASAASANYYDQGAVEDFGAGETMFALIGVDVAFTDGSSDSTVTVTLETDDNTSFSSATTVQTIGTFAALSAIGTTLKAKIQPSSLWERYIRFSYTVANGNLTTGSLTAIITKDIDLYRSYPKGYTIS